MKIVFVKLPSIKTFGYYDKKRKKMLWIGYGESYQNNITYYLR